MNEDANEESGALMYTSWGTCCECSIRGLWLWDLDGKVWFSHECGHLQVTEAQTKEERAKEADEAKIAKEARKAKERESWVKYGTSLGNSK